MLSLIIVVGIAFAMQGLFSFLQMRHLSNEFIKLRRKGKVAFGRKSGGFHAGAVVMFRIDDDGIIQEGKKGRPHRPRKSKRYARFRGTLHRQPHRAGRPRRTQKSLQGNRGCFSHLPQIHSGRDHRRAAHSPGKSRNRNQRSVRKQGKSLLRECTALSL